MKKAFLSLSALIITTLLTQAQLIPRVATLPVTSTTSTSAVSGGEIFVSDPTPTAKGVCWSTHPDPVYPADNHTLDGDGMEPFTSHINGLTPFTKYYLRAYASNVVGTGYGNQVIFYSVGIGDFFQGGKVFYILKPGDKGYDPEIQHGLIAAPKDLVRYYPWGSKYLWVPYTEIGVGEGKSNTIAIRKADWQICNPVTNREPLIAADICHRMITRSNGQPYDGWFLPSFNELEELYKTRELVGGFCTEGACIYWSSSQRNLMSSYVIEFGSGFHNAFPKEYKLRVRCIKNF